MKILLCIYKASSVSEKKINSIGQFYNSIIKKYSLTILQPIFNGRLESDSFLINLHSGIDLKGINLYIDSYSYFKKSSLNYAVMEKYSHCVFFDNENIDEASLVSYLSDYQLFKNQKAERLGLSGNLLSKLVSTIVGKKFVHLFTEEIIALPTKAIEKIPYHQLSNGSKLDVELAFQLSQLDFEPRETIYTAIKNRSVSLQSFSSFLLEWFKLYISNRGLVFQPKYDVEKTNSHYPLKLGYTSSHTLALNALEGAASVLDIGSGPTPISYELTQKNIDVLTVDLHPPTEQKFNYQHYIQDLNQPLDIDVSKYQNILLLDIIEHLHNPELFLENLTEQFKTDGHKIICTTGNIAFLPMRISLLLGKFNYGKRGILDRTHTRLYTFFTFRDLISRSGMTVTKIRGIPVPFPLALGDNSFSKFLVKLNECLIFFSKSIFSFQIYIEATSQPSFNSQIVDVKKVSK
mgnify:CR=1 FL=1